MPDLRGDEVLTQILDSNPSARVILSSGYSEKGEAIGTCYSHETVEFIGKPFSIENLLGMIHLDAVDDTCFRGRASTAPALKQAACPCRPVRVGSSSHYNTYMTPHPPTLRTAHSSINIRNRNIIRLHLTYDMIYF